MVNILFDWLLQITQDKSNKSNKYKIQLVVVVVVVANICIVQISFHPCLIMIDACSTILVTGDAMQVSI